MIWGLLNSQRRGVKKFNARLMVVVESVAFTNYASCSIQWILRMEVNEFDHMLLILSNLFLSKFLLMVYTRLKIQGTAYLSEE